MWICCPHTKWFYVGMLNVLFSPQAAKRGDTRSTWTEEGRLYTLRCRKEGIKPEYQPAIQYVPQDNRDQILLPDTPHSPRASAQVGLGETKTTTHPNVVFCDAPQYLRDFLEKKVGRRRRHHRRVPQKLQLAFETHSSSQIHETQWPTAFRHFTTGINTNYSSSLQETRVAYGQPPSASRKKRERRRLRLYGGGGDSTPWSFERPPLSCSIPLPSSVLVTPGDFVSGTASTSEICSSGVARCPTDDVA